MSFMMDEEKQKLPIQKLTAGPGLNAVSEAAKGEEPESRQEEQQENLKIPGVEEECSYSSDDMERAYASLFESLAMILRGKSNHS